APGGTSATCGSSSRRRPNRLAGSPGARSPSTDLGRNRRPLVNVDEAAVVRRDGLPGPAAVEPGGVGGVRLDRLREDRAPDREADVAVEPGRRAQPLVHLRVRRTAAEDDARDAIAALAAAELGDLATRLPVVEALDLPDVRLDAAVLQLQDRLQHQLWAQLGVVAIFAAVDAGQLGLLG